MTNFYKLTRPNNSKRTSESPDVLNARNREFRKRMREKGFKYLCVWVPPFLEEKIMKMVNDWKIHNIS
ncbi:MAG: hypothetical protein ACTHME_05200 [Candidatus Nitrosocosmicus sp.]